MAVVSQGTPKRVVVIGDVTSTTGQIPQVITGVASGSTHASVNCEGYTSPVLYVNADGACSAGTILIEERDQPQDSPSLVATITLSSPFASAGGQYAYHLPVSSYGYLSARIGTSVVGALVSAVLRVC